MRKCVYGDVDPYPRESKACYLTGITGDLSIHLEGYPTTHRDSQDLVDVKAERVVF